MSLAATFPACASSTRVQDIVIDFGWGGLGPATTESYTIRREGDGYVGDGERETQSFPAGGRGSTQNLGKRNFDADDVEGLVSALRGPIVSMESARQQLLPPERMADVAERLYAKGHVLVPSCSPAGKRLFLSQFTDPDRVMGGLKMYFEGRWTDDYPSVKIRVNFEDGSSLQAGSTSQKRGMLPWTVPAGVSFDPSIPTRLAMVLPARMHLRERLDLDGLAAAIKPYVLMPAKPELEDLEERCQHPEVFDRVETLGFHVERVIQASPDAAAAYVTRPDFPPNLKLYFVFFEGKSTGFMAGMEAFERKREKYIALAIPFAVAHPNQSFELMFYRDASITDLDLDVRVPESQRKRIAKLADDVAVLFEPAARKRAYWFVLPDGTVIRSTR